jgi:hypothetical protein
LKWKKKGIPNLDHPTRTPSKLTELKDNNCKHTAIIKKLIKVSFKIKAVVPLPGSLTNNNKLPVGDENPLNATITSNSNKNPGKQNKALKLENVPFRPAKHVLGNNITTDHSNVQTNVPNPMILGKPQPDFSVPTTPMGEKQPLMDAIQDSSLYSGLTQVG